MTIGDRIKKRRESFIDFSQEKLAKMVGYSGRSSINKIELNKGKVDIDMIVPFAKALKTSPAYLMGWVDDPELTHEETLKLEEMRTMQNPKHDNMDIIIPHLDTSPVLPDQIRTIAANTGDFDGDTLTSDFPEISEEQQKRNRLAYKILNSDYSADEIDKIEAMIDLLVKK